MSKTEIRETLIKFCELVLEKQPEAQSVKVVVGMKDKSKVKFKKFREHARKTD